MTKILVVEDEPHIRESLVEELMDEGYEVVWRENGRDGLQAILEERPDIIISDCLMPVMSGVEMLGALRADHPEFDDTPFIFLSAHADQANVEAGISHGATAYLTKPVDFDKLHATLMEIRRR